ncbi:hypothetical protein MTO96_022121 [Rhipicephalus appendiculatus]
MNHRSRTAQPTPFRDAQERTDRESQTTRSTGSQFNVPSFPPLIERKLERERSERNRRVSQRCSSNSR